MKKNKLVVCILIILFLLIVNLNNVLALDLGKILPDGDDMLAKANSVGNEDNIYDGFNSIAGILTFIGVFAAAIIGIALGIRFMFAASAEQKADIKKSMMPWVTGTAIILGALIIWNLSIDIIQDIHKDTAGSNAGSPTYTDSNTSPSDKYYTRKYFDEMMEYFDVKNSDIIGVRPVNTEQWLEEHPDFDNNYADNWYSSKLDQWDGIRITAHTYTYDDYYKSVRFSRRKV